MIRIKHVPPNGVDHDAENSRNNSSRHNFEPNNEYPDEKVVDFLTDSQVVDKILHSKLNLVEKEKSLLNYSMEKVSHKGKEVVAFSENSNQDRKWVERDFLSLSESKENSSKRRTIEEVENESYSEKKQKLETLNLSLALPNVSLSLTASNVLQNKSTMPSTTTHTPTSVNSSGTCLIPLKQALKQGPGFDPCGWNKCSLGELAPHTCGCSRLGQDCLQCEDNCGKPKKTTTHTSFSNDYTYSHQFSHNPSCSITHNSTENFDFSVSKDDHIWNCGEGTNGSVHSRFKPIGDSVGVAFSNYGQHKTTSSENHSFFPSELHARPRFETLSGDSMGRNSENLRVLDGLDGGKIRKISRPERIIREIVSESILAMAVTIPELNDEVIESTKEYLKNLIEKGEKKEELVSLQNRLERRSDLTKESLSKCDKVQLEVLVAVKMGHASFLSGKVNVFEMVEIFLYRMCRNVNCKSVLPVDDCECKICSGNKGFCSSCMCPVCLNFDCANNTCSWIGCDVCSHWCHATCGIQRNLIKPGPSLKGPSGTSEVQFHCIGCGHASEMFGFVKDVFVCCAKDWGIETLMKELDCVRRIFRGSEDRKGKELHVRTDDMLLKLQTKMIAPSEACNYIIQFFSYADSMPDFPVPCISSKDLATSQAKHSKENPSFPKSSSLIPKYPYDMSYSPSHSDTHAMSNDHPRKDLKASLLSELKTEADFHLEALLRKGGVESLESVVRIKEAEARMFQTKADEAMREAEGFRRMIRTKTAQMEQEYAEKLGKLRLLETEETRRRTSEELKVLEISHYDYCKMKMRMQDEIAGLLERMEATKQQWF